MSEREHWFELRQNGMVVADVSGYDRDRCLREIQHYAAVYRQDGPVAIHELSAEEVAEREAEFADEP